MGMIKRDTPRILINDICKGISQQTDLSEKQVKECFRAYADIIKGMADSPNRPKDLAVILPYLGYVCFRRRKGFKAGERKGLLKPKYCEVETATKTDKPDYDILVFQFSKKLNSYVRETTSKQITLKQKMDSIYKRDDYIPPNDKGEVNE